MKKYIHRGVYSADYCYQNEDIAIYDGIAYVVDIPKDEHEYNIGIINECPRTSKYWKRLVPVQDEIEIKFKHKEIEMITSCIKMALKEGLYDFDIDGIEHSDEDMLLILMKLGVDKKKAEDMIKYC